MGLVVIVLIVKHTSMMNNGDFVNFTEYPTLQIQASSESASHERSTVKLALVHCSRLARVERVVVVGSLPMYAYFVHIRGSYLYLRFRLSLLINSALTCSLRAGEHNEPCVIGFGPVLVELW